MSATVPITSRFDASSTALEVVAGRHLHGLTVVVTGGASGIGLETTRALAGAGATVVIGVRDPGATRTVLETIEAPVEVLALDLVDPASIRSFATAFGEAHPRLDVLVCNAGISYTPESHAPDGRELRWATNHLGHFLLYALLEPALAAAAPSRVVVVSSAAHKFSAVDFDDVHYRSRPFDAFAAYGQSKSANVLFAVELTRRAASRGIVANAVSPGSSLTRLQRHIPTERMIVNGLLNADGTPAAAVRTVEQCAATSVWAAVDPVLVGIGGLYLEDCGVAAPYVEGEMHPWAGYAAHATDPARAARLWAMSVEMVGI